MLKYGNNIISNGLNYFLLETILVFSIYCLDEDFTL